MKAERGSTGIAVLFNLTLDGMFGLCLALVALPPGKRSGTFCTGGWVGPSADIDG